MNHVPEVCISLCNAAALLALPLLLAMWSARRLAPVSLENEGGEGVV